jgi:shikimate dehydrogenase
MSGGVGDASWGGGAGDRLRFAVLGDPIAHSKSPRIHAAAYAALGMPHTYEALRTPLDALPATLARLRAGEFAGFNVTVPLKRAVLDFVDDVGPSAALVGAANTIVRETRADGVRLRAFNTDVPALADEIGALLPRAPRRALVLGTGGAARGAVVALVSRGCTRIVVRGRSDPESFVASLRASLAGATDPRAHAVTVDAEEFAPNVATEADVEVVVQATSAGMTGAAGGAVDAEVTSARITGTSEPPVAGDAVAEAVAWDALPAGAVAIDVIYAPPETPFLRAARAHGLAAANGLGMLARQGALAFACWLGAPVERVLAPMLAALESS